MCIWEDWGSADGTDYCRIKKSVNRIWYTMMKAIPENIRKEAPFTISELEDIYPTASKKVRKTKRSVRLPWRQPASCRPARQGYRALLAHILDVSVTDLKEEL